MIKIKFNIKNIALISCIGIMSTSMNNCVLAEGTLAVIPWSLTSLFTEEELKNMQIVPITELIDVADELYITQESLEDKVAQIIKDALSNSESKTMVEATIGSNIIAVQGVNYEVDTAPYLSNGNTMVPLRFVCNALGITPENIIYNYYEKTINIIIDDANYEFNQEKDFAVKQSRTKTEVIYFPPNTTIETINNTVFLPIRVLQDIFNAELYWDNASSKAILIKNNNIIDENSSSSSSSSTETQSQTVQISNLLSSEQKSSLENQLVEAINQERIKNNLSPLEVSSQLMDTAYYKAKDMAQNNYFSHTDLNGTTLANRLAVSENISAGQNTVSSVLSTLMIVDENKRNILDPSLRYIGVGYEEQNNSTYGYYWVQQFSSDDKWSNSVIKDNTEVNNILNNTTALAVTQSNNEPFITPSVSITFLSSQEISAFEQELVRLINQARTNQGLQPLILSSSLSNISRQKSDDMAYKNYLGHADKGGKILYQTIEGSAYPTITENYGGGTTSASELFNIWFSIESQKEKILSPTNTYIGVGFTQNLGSDLKYYTSAHFSNNSKWQ